MTIEAFAYPTTIKEAVALLGDEGRHALCVGGGTALSKAGRGHAQLLVDVTRCGMDVIEVQHGELRLGGAARADAVAHAELPGAEGQLLHEAAAGIASQPLRNAITVGGNLFHLAAWSDLPVALLALDASVQVETMAQGAFSVPMGALVAEHPTKVLPRGALITRATVRHREGQRGAAYRRYRLTATDFSLVTVAAVVTLDAGRISEAAVALGAVTPRPRRCAAVEMFLLGKAPDAAVLAEAGKLALTDVHVAPNYRLASEVRGRIAAVEVQRALATAVARAQGKEVNA